MGKEFVKYAVGLILLLLAAVPAVAGPTEDAQAAFQNGDYGTALRLWLPLAEQGNADAQNGLGRLSISGLGVAQDYKEAAMWFRKAAEQGSPAGQFNLGTLYRAGAVCLNSFALEISGFLPGFLGWSDTHLGCDGGRA